MPESLTRKKTSPGVQLQIGTASGFKSEWWPASNRNRVRLRVGIPVRNASESAPKDGIPILGCSTEAA